MAFLIFVLAICVFILFNNFYNLKKENSFIKSILERNSEENSSLRKEISEIKKLIDSKLVPLSSAEIVSKENLEKVDENLKQAIDENLKQVQIEEYQPYFTPIPDAEVSKQSESIEEISQIVESPLITEEKSDANLKHPKVSGQIEPISTYDSQTSPRQEKQEDENLKQVQIEESAFSKFLKTAEKQFADNWTGILGTAIMVLGIGYLSIYTALKVTPLFRVLILWLYAGVLFGSYYILQKKEKWVTTGLWMRSAGASLFLFGCFGASQIPKLAFISNPIVGYSLIGLGIALNLFVGYIIKKQTFLSLHVILSMLILCVIPEKTIATILLASITATIGIILSYKEKWEYHLLIVIGAFIIFDIWFNAQGTKLSTTENIIAILGIITVAGSCMFMQYRKVYENTHLDQAGFITHLINWILFATALILHSTGSKFKTIVLFGGAIICLFISIRARKKNVFWLYHLDGMVSFTLLALSIIMLTDLKVGMDIIACILYLLIVVCLFIVYKEKEVLLHKIFLALNHLFGFALLIFCILMISNSLDNTKITSAIAATIFLSVIAVSIPIITSIKKDFSTVDSFFGGKSLSLNGLLALLFSLFIIIKSAAILIDNCYYYSIFIIAIIWTFLRKKFNNPTFDIGRLFFYVLTIVLGVLIIFIQQENYIDGLFAICFLIVVVLNWFVKIFYKNDFVIRFLAIIGINALVLVLTFKYLNNTPIIEIFTLFGIALANHEFLWLNFRKNNLKQDLQTLLYIFYYFFAFAASILFLFNLRYLSITEIGLTCLGISAIETYALFAKRIRNNAEETTKEWSDFNFINSELLLFNCILFGFSCLQLDYLSIYFACFALVFFITFKKFDECKRYELYSFIFLLGSIILTLIVAVNNYYDVEKSLIYGIQSTTVLVSILYAYLQFKSKDEKGKRFIVALSYIQNLWIIVLLFIQVEIKFLPLLLMVLGFINLWLIDKQKIRIKIDFVPIIAGLSIVLSTYYSFDSLNSFNIFDWILQLSSVVLGLILVIFLTKKEELQSYKNYFQITLNIWLSLIMFSQLQHKWLPVYWASVAILNIFLYHKKISQEKNIGFVYYLLANLHLAFLSFNFYQSKYLAIYLLIFALLAVYIYLASKWTEDFKLKNSLLIYPATLSIGFFLYLTFDKGILTVFWILEALGLLILGIILKEKYFRYVSLSLVGICIVRLMFFDLSNADFLIRAMVLLGVGVVLLVMNSLFKKYKDRFD